MRLGVVSALFAVFLFSLGGDAQAEEQAKERSRSDTSFEQLPGKLKIGQTVYVMDGLARETEGRFVQVSDRSLTLLVQGSEREFPRSDVQRVARRGDPLRNGIVIGMAVTGGLGLLSVLTDDCAREFAAGTCAAVVGLNTALGAGVGALIDYGVKGKTVIYRTEPVAVSAAPLLSLSQKGAGLQLAVRF